MGAGCIMRACVCTVQGCLVLKAAVVTRCIGTRARVNEVSLCWWWWWWGARFVPWGCMLCILCMLCATKAGTAAEGYVVYGTRARVCVCVCVCICVCVYMCVCVYVCVCTFERHSRVPGCMLRGGSLAAWGAQPVHEQTHGCVMGQGSGRLARSHRVQLTPIPQADSKQFAAAEQECMGHMDPSPCGPTNSVEPGACMSTSGDSDPTASGSCVCVQSHALGGAEMGRRGCSEGGVSLQVVM